VTIQNGNGRLEHGAQALNQEAPQQPVVRQLAIHLHGGRKLLILGAPMGITQGNLLDSLDAGDLLDNLQARKEVAHDWPLSAHPCDKRYITDQ